MTSRIFAVFASSCAICFTGADWRQFRGNDASSVATDAQLPVEWTAENVSWKASLPGRGLSGPIVVGNRVVVTACTGFKQDRLHVLCFDTATGKSLWERQFWATGRTMCHPKMSVASSTPASDGKRVYAMFSTNDVICLDLDGNLQWLRGLTHDYPNASNSLGMASSPLIVGDTLVVQVENDSESFAIGLDSSTGENRWKIDRPILANWTSPSLLSGKTRSDDVVLLQSGKGLAAVEPATGREVWRYGEGCGTIPSLVVSDGVVYVPSKGITALKHDGTESTAKVLWQSGKLGPGTASPVLLEGSLFTVNPAGVLTCGDPATGEPRWQLRLQGPFTSTPVAANGHLYFVNEAGLAQVVKPGKESGEVVSTHDFAEVILCSPAAANGALYVRSDGHLWKIARK